MKKIISLMTVLALSICILAGCQGGNSDDSSAKGIKMFMTVSTADTFRQNLMDAAKEKAKSMGAELTADDAEGSLEKQMAQIEGAVKDGYNVILCNPVDVDTALQLQLAAGDLPIIFWNSCPNEAMSFS